jgi:hypothetical protein
MPDQSPVKIVTGVVNAAKPVVKLVAMTETVVYSAATGDKDVVSELCQVVDKIFDELKK